jgi:MinD-like ATPase involved in chromosome partitioning or flagellar assembly
MALANVAVLLSRWGYKTLIIDWDLEAPGLENFFKVQIKVKNVYRRKGLIDILTSEPQDPHLWKELLIPIDIPEGKVPLDFLAAGDRSNDYFNKVREFDINTFYEKKDGGNFIEELRNQWKDAYDFILVDSRTGVTDIGGICTIQLPDVLVLLFTATDLGFNGALDVSQRAVKAQQSLPFDRFKLISLPIPARFDTVTEFKNSQEWLDKFSEQLKGIYRDWLPTSVDSRKFLELTKIPYVSYFSFGEKLPVIEQGVNDPTGLGYAYETISALIVNNFNYIDELMNNRDAFINKAVKDQFEIAGKEEIDSVKVYISYSHKDIKFKRKLESYLKVPTIERFATFWSDQEVLPGMDVASGIEEYLKNSHIYLLLISSNYLASNNLNKELTMIHNRAEKNNDILVIPILLTPASWKKVPFLKSRRVLPLNGKSITEWENQEDAIEEIAEQIEKAIFHIRNKKVKK